MRRRLTRSRAWAAALALGLGGCVGPDFHPPAPPAAERFTARPLPAKTQAADGPHGAAQSFAVGRDIPAAWWRLFGSPALDTLIGEALAASPDVAAADAALRAAREATEAQRGGFWPQVAGAFSSTRAKAATGAVSATSTAVSPVSTLHTAQLSATYTPDVWGAEWRAVESQEAQEEAQRVQTEAARQTLAAALVDAAIGEAGLRGQIDAQREVVAIERDVLEIQRRMLGLGQIAGADVAVQEAALAQAEAALPGLERQLAVQRDALAALLGRLPERAPTETFDLAAFTLPEEVPLGLPAGLVARRPDIRQAEANLHAASAAVGVALAARLPLISLSADLGSVAARLGGSDSGYSPTKAGLFTPGTGFWSLTAGLSQPLFDGFTLRHRHHQAQALLEQAEAQYRSTVIAAFREVADQLESLRADADTLAATRAAEQAAERSLAITRRQLDLGAVAPLVLLTAQQTMQQTRAARIQAEAARLADTAALLHALGGGWWENPAQTDG